MSYSSTCVARVADNGDNTSCGKEVVGQGLCMKHLCRELANLEAVFAENMKVVAVMNEKVSVLRKLVEREYQARELLGHNMTIHALEEAERIARTYTDGMATKASVSVAQGIGDKISAYRKEGFQNKS